MHERKYVILRDDSTGKEYAVIFDRDLSHSAVAGGVINHMAGNTWGPRMFLEPVSAGFVTPDLELIEGRGSESLSLNPRASDAAILRPQAPFSYPLIVSAATGPAHPPKPHRKSLLERAKGAKGR